MRRFILKYDVFTTVENSLFLHEHRYRQSKHAQLL